MLPEFLCEYAASMLPEFLCEYAANMLPESHCAKRPLEN